MSAAVSAPWGSRPEVGVLDAAGLAGLVDAAVDRAAGMLFTATPREDLDEIGRFQQLKDAAWVGQVRAIVAAYNRASESEREFAGDEVALAVGAAPGTGSRLVLTALSAAELPGLLEAVEAGVLTERHVLAVLRELDLVPLSLEQRQAIVLVLLARYAGQAPGELMKLVRRLVLTVDRAAAQARQDTADRQRSVHSYADVDGQGVLHARGPLAQIAAMKAALTASLAATDKVSGDERGAAEREFDLLVELLTSSREPSGWHQHIITPFSTAAGGDLELADIPGYGPVLPSTARDLLDQTLDLTHIAVHEAGSVISVSSPQPAPKAESGAEVWREAILALGRAPLGPDPQTLTTRAYRVPLRVQRQLQARDLTCVFPGCSRPAAQTDADHRIPWPAGATSVDNLQCLCRHHHRAKHTSFSVELTHDEHYLWTSRGGWQFPRQRQGY